MTKSVLLVYQRRIREGLLLTRDSDSDICVWCVVGLFLQISAYREPGGEIGMMSHNNTFTTSWKQIASEKWFFIPVVATCFCSNLFLFSALLCTYFCIVFSCYIPMVSVMGFFICHVYNYGSFFFSINV